MTDFNLETVLETMIKKSINDKLGDVSPGTTINITLEMKPLKDFDDFANDLNVSKRTLEGWARNDDIEAIEKVKFGKRVFINTKKLLECL